MNYKVGMVSLGCPKNQVDAEMLLFALQQYGYTLTGDAAMADVVIINTCGFITSAKEEAIENILEFAALKKEGKIKLLCVTGCLAERYRDQLLAELPEVDLVVGIGANARLPELIDEALAKKHTEKLFTGEKADLPLNGGRIQTTLPFYAYLKIAEGCDNHCTYCAIPSIRGRFRSRKMEDVITEAKRLAAEGVTELVIVAQDTTRYGEDLYGHAALPELLRQLCEIEGLRWIRTLYTYPERITDELLDAIREEEKLVNYLDIPIQHCDGEILKRMNRRGDRASLTALISHIRKRVPGIVLRTTMLVGFPGESEEQFAELCDFVREIGFDRLGCFAYSQEEGTPAAALDGQLSDEVKERRAELLMETQADIMIAKNEERVGQEATVITEGFDRYAECFFGRSEADAPEIDGKIFFTVSGERPRLGDYLTVRLEEVMDYDLIGSAVEEAR